MWGRRLSKQLLSKNSENIVKNHEVCSFRNVRIHQDQSRLFNIGTSVPKGKGKGGGHPQQLEQVVRKREIYGRHLATSSSSASGSSSATSSSSTSTSSTSSSSSSGSTAFLQQQGTYEEAMYNEWKIDPQRVHPSWDAYFRSLQTGTSFSYASPTPKMTSPAATDLHRDDFYYAQQQQPQQQYQQPTPQQQQQQQPQQMTEPAIDEFGMQSIAIVHLIEAYQSRGHIAANLDPLGLWKRRAPVDLDPATYGFTENDMDMIFDVPGYPGLTGIMDGSLGGITLRDLVDRLRRMYCSEIGVEYTHIQNLEQKNFIRDRFEMLDAARNGLTHQERLTVLDRLHYAELFEQFLAKRFSTAKRFGLEGCESLIPGFKAFIDKSSELGARNFVVGMPHRGRLNVMANVMRKPLEMVFSEFHGTNIDAQKFYDSLIAGYSQSGDVKYHLGTSFTREYPDGRKVHMALLANPSHLEAVDPVVEGKARAKQHYRSDFTGDTVIPVLMHGDAAFSGQGVVYETMELSKLPMYGTGGTLHIIVNNQLGFTTDPEEGRSSMYSSDLGKALQCPIFHVNADEPDAVTYVFKVAAEWRQKFHTDVIIDVVGYRRFGHNEMDEPSFTQPTMYNAIKSHPTVLTSWSRRVVQDKLCDQATVDNIRKQAETTLESSFEQSKNTSAADFKEDWLDSRWKGFKSTSQLARIRRTGVKIDTLREIADHLYTLPEGFKAHKNIARQLQHKKSMFSGEPDAPKIDWACAEHLAYGSLVLEGNHVRLSGQDSERGTFSHRHATVFEQDTNERWCPLSTLQSNLPPAHETGDSVQLTREAATFHACNSPLSEFAVCGFELGYSLENPNALIMWEAQFGDFMNGAQIVIDQFLSCGENKWLRQSGLVLLLPHGYDGQGPEHSSCRLERFLQLSDEDQDFVPKLNEDERMQIQQSNWQVVNCTTPAQIFHVLRRQIHREFRKPLIVASPKMLLRYKECVSDLSEFDLGQKFKRLIPEVDPEIDEQDPAKIRKLVFCSGKIYYHLTKARADAGDRCKDVAIVRIEQICPFPYDKVADQVKKYPNAELIYVQEEPKNMGAWVYADDRIYTAIKTLCPEVNDGRGSRCKYVGRKTMASPAVGYGAVHNHEQENIIQRALE